MPIPTSGLPLIGVNVPPTGRWFHYLDRPSAWWYVRRELRDDPGRRTTVGPRTGGPPCPRCGNRASPSPSGRSRDSRLAAGGAAPPPPLQRHRPHHPPRRRAEGGEALRGPRLPRRQAVQRPARPSAPALLRHRARAPRRRLRRTVRDVSHVAAGAAARGDATDAPPRRPLADEAADLRHQREGPARHPDPPPRAQADRLRPRRD